MDFRLVDPDDDVEVTRRNLPHWEQQGATYFITFRTADSLPAAVLHQWLNERNAWLRRHGLEPMAADCRQTVERLDPAAREEYRRLHSRPLEDLLDRGYGECLLRQPPLAAIVAKSLLSFNGTRYHMGDFVVMPNHVHLLAQFIGPTRLKEQCRSWKRFTAGSINRAVGRQGHFWQGESYDHLVRNAEEFDHYREYIAENPRLAGLREGEYLLHQRPDL